MSEKLTKLEQVALVALQGLLASGHYTRIREDDEDDAGEPDVFRYDHGDDWQKQGYPNRCCANAASDAFIVARDFMRESAAWDEIVQRKS